MIKVSNPVAVCLVFALSSFLLSCGNQDLPQYTKLDRLRVLAIIANPPEFQNPAAGTRNVDIIPYISDVGGSGDITLTIQSCLDPGTTLGVAPSCDGAAFASSPRTLTMSASAGTFGTPERTGAPAAAITEGLIVPSGLLSQYSTAVQNNGIAYLITLDVRSSSDRVRAFRRIIMSNRTVNSNPNSPDLLSGSTSLTTRPSGEVELSFSTTSTPENYTELSADGSSFSRTETFELTWFTSDGEILNPRTKSGETTKWTAPSEAPVGRATVLAGVLRDGRGGVSVVIKNLN